MNTEKLKEYLKSVLELEKNKYETERLLENLKSKHYEGEKVEGEQYSVDKQHIKSTNKDFIITIVCAFVGAMIASQIGNLIGYAFKNGIIEHIMTLVGIFLGVCLSLQKRRQRESKEAEEKAKQLKKEAEKSQMEAKRQTEINMERAKNQNIIVQNAIRETTTAYDDTVRVLEKIYSSNIIYPSYRNFIAISSIYQYFESGICETLEGHEGAYSRYEIESRLDKIVTQIDVVIAKLDQIAQNQYTLYSAIREITPQIQNMTNQIDNAISKLEDNNVILNTVEKNSAITAANSAMTAYTANLIAKNQYYESVGHSLVSPLQ